MTPCEIPDLSTNTSSVLVRNFEQSLGSLRMSLKRTNYAHELLWQVWFRRVYRARG